jgi:hypothetical protein
MSVVSDLTNQILFDILEDPPIGPILGVLTMAQLIDLVNLTLYDWNQKTCAISQVQTQYAEAGVSRYTYPESMMRIDEAFLAGVLLEPTTVQALSNGMRGWRTELKLPTRWHADELPLKTIELAPVPNDTGVFVVGPNQPDPPYAQTGWNVVLNSTVYTPDQHRDITLIGPQLPAVVASTTDPLCYGSTGAPTAFIPQDFCLGYIGFGLLARIFSGDNEIKDNARAEWAQGEYMEGVQIVRAMMGEPDTA